MDGNMLKFFIHYCLFTLIVKEEDEAFRESHWKKTLVTSDFYLSCFLSFSLPVVFPNLSIILYWISFYFLDCTWKATGCLGQQFGYANQDSFISR